LCFAAILALAVAGTRGFQEKIDAAAVAATAATAAAATAADDAAALAAAASMARATFGPNHPRPIPGDPDAIRAEPNADEFHANLDHNKDGVITAVRGYCLLLY
jgi:hypothetical protein